MVRNFTDVATKSSRLTKSYFFFITPSLFIRAGKNYGSAGVVVRAIITTESTFQLSYFKTKLSLLISYQFLLQHAASRFIIVGIIREV